MTTTTPHSINDLNEIHNIHDIHYTNTFSYFYTRFQNQIKKKEGQPTKTPTSNIFDVQKEEWEEKMKKKALMFHCECYRNIQWCTHILNFSWTWNFPKLKIWIRPSTLATMPICHSLMRGSCALFHYYYYYY